MIGGMWRWLWTASVFGVFALVVTAALKGAPPRDGIVPVIAAGTAPIKESVELAPVDASVPESSVLNLLADGDDPDAAVAAARAGLDRGAAADTADAGDVAALEAALRGPGAADDTSTEGAPAVATLMPGDGFRIQIAAVRPGEEHDAFDDLQARYRTILGDLSPRFQVFTSDSGVLVRVQAGPLAAEDEAVARCRRLEKAGGECFVVSGPG